MDWFGILGYLGVWCFYPAQLWRIYRYKRVVGLSAPALWTLTIGLLGLQVSMTFYGGYPLYAMGNGCSFLCACAMLVGYYLYRDNQ